MSGESTLNVGLTQRPGPIVVYSCGGTDTQEDLYKRHTPETSERRWPGSSSGWEANLQEQLIEWKDIFSRYGLRVRLETTEVMWVGHRRKKLQVHLNGMKLKGQKKLTVSWHTPNSVNIK